MQGRETSSHTGLPTNTLMESVDGLFQVISKLQPSDTGRFLDWKGNRVAW